MYLLLTFYDCLLEIPSLEPLAVQSYVTNSNYVREFSCSCLASGFSPGVALLLVAVWLLELDFHLSI